MPNGYRALGTSVPGRISCRHVLSSSLGGLKPSFVDVMNPEKTVVVELRDEEYQQLIIEVEDPGGGACFAGGLAPGCCAGKTSSLTPATATPSRPAACAAPKPSGPGGSRLPQYQVLRQAATEPPYRNAYCRSYAPGRYACAGCGSWLFEADTKYHAISGWPSFRQPASRAAIAYYFDESFGMQRMEARCNVCEGHLGHVFADGPSRPACGTASTRRVWCW